MKYSPAARQKFAEAQSALASRHISRSLELLDGAERLGYNRDECSACRWNCYMLTGRFEDAWSESDAIARRGAADPNLLWDGQTVAGKRVITRCLHGFGDAIQFVRYAALVREQAASVTLQTAPELVPLLQGADGVDCVTSWDSGPGRRFKEWDQQIEVMELPRVFRTNLATIPHRIPYLRVASRYREKSTIPGSKSEKLKIGVLWEASSYNLQRNISLTSFEGLFRNESVDWYSFQRGPGRDQLFASGLSGRVRDHSGDSPDVAWLAADLLNVDLLISVDSMPVHLAGALGRPVWVLLPHQADWRWMLDRPDSPWYPTMRLFRQPAPGDWEEPLRRVARELEKFVAQFDQRAEALDMARPAASLP